MLDGKLQASIYHYWMCFSIKFRKSVWAEWNYTVCVFSLVHIYNWVVFALILFRQVSALDHYDIAILRVNTM